MQRMCYSIDFSAGGKLKMAGGRLNAIARHNNRKPDTPQDKKKRFPETDGERRRRPHAANIDGGRTAQNYVWINPAHGGGGWTATADLSDDAAAPIWAALGNLLGIKTGDDGRLRYGEGNGQRKTKTTATAATVARRERRRKQHGGLLVKADAVLAVDLVLQASPTVFFPKLREEHWTQEQIDRSAYEPDSRGPVDMAAVHDFREAGLRWAADRFGAERIAEVALHLDEASPHLHVVVIPEKNGKLNASKLIGGATKAKEMLDEMEPYFNSINGLKLERPTEGGPSTGKTYAGLNRRLLEENKRLTEENARLREENDRLAAEAAAATTARNTAVAATYASGQRAKAADESRRRREAEAKEAEKQAEQAEQERRRAQEATEQERQRAQEAADAVGLPLPAAMAATACWRAAVATCPELEGIPAENWETIWQ